ncbi:MAG: aspartate kinase [Thermoplasmata archaeon]|nr:MAG: aspartate kinase [Thermoplasmata archaeon]
MVDLDGPIVHKFGGSCLATPELTIRCSRIATDAFSAPRKAVMVVSALRGQTNLIREMMDSLMAGGDGIDNFMEEVRARHQYMAQSTIMDRHIRSGVMERVETLATRLERLLYGVIYTEELTDRSRDQALTHGERMSAHIFAGVLMDKDVPAAPLEADEAGVITDGVFGSATADIDATSLHLGNTISDVLGRGEVPVLTGFFGSDMDGHTTTFGRNGSDYSAAVAARALGSPVLTLWKDVSGFMSADPSVVAKAKLVPLISYEEAAELAYFGLEVLHPRTVEPLRPASIPIQIRDIHNPESAGSMISPRAETNERAIKSITCASEIAILNVHSASIGIRPRLLSRIIAALAKADVQILGLSTSQASLGVVLRAKDLGAAETSIRSFKLPELERIESTTGFALVGAVGAGALEDPSVVPRMMATLSDLGHGVATVASGPSSAAAYFVVDEGVAHRAVEMVHAEFCEDD